MNLYLTLKALHLIAVISWMAGLLYLPRIFVYHSEAKSQEVKETFKIMERRLFLYIMNPAMILTWLIGFLLIHSIGLPSLKELWLFTKIFLVIFLTIYHFYLGSCIKSLKNGDNTKSSKFFRIANEIPTILLILVVFLAILKPI